MIRSLNLSVASLVLLTLISCTGYPDGPAISFRSAEVKLVNTWSISEATRNGVDISTDFAEEYYRFREDGNFERLESSFSIEIPPNPAQTSSELASGEWYFRNDQSQLEVLYQFRFRDPINSSVEYVKTVNELWDIARLTQEELWLTDDSTILKMVLF